MIKASSLLDNVHEYEIVKRFTRQPKRMKEAYECKLDKVQAITLLAILMDEWPPVIPADKKLSSKRFKVIWNNVNGKARGGYLHRDDGTLRPFLKLPVKDLTAGLLLHEYCHVITIFMEKEIRAERNNKRRSPHGESFRAMFDVLLVTHQSDWINVTNSA